MTYAILGARGRVTNPEASLKTAREWASQQGCEVLVADAQLVIGQDHLDSAVRHAMRAHERRTMVAHTLSMETLRYLAAQRQVADAIRLAGIRVGTETIAMVVFGPDDGNDLVETFRWIRDDAVLNARGKDLSPFGLTKIETATVPERERADLVLERLALLDVQK